MRLPSPLRAAQQLARTWPRELTIAPETGLPVCIQSTRLAYDAFRAAGVNGVEPLSCEVSVFNPPAVRCLLGDARNTDSARARIVRIGSTPPEIDDNSEGWNGHLILEHPAFLLDLVLGGGVMALVDKKDAFEDMGAFCAEKHAEATLEADGSWTAMTDRGVLIVYRPTPENDGWKQTEAWGSSQPEIVDMVAGIISAWNRVAP